MSDVAWGVAVVLLTGALWVVGGVLQGHNLRQLEKLVARLPDALDDRLRGGPAAGVIDHDRRAGRRQVLGNRGADSFRRPRDDGDLPFQFLRHGGTP